MCSARCGIIGATRWAMVVMASRRAARRLASAGLGPVRAPGKFVDAGDGEVEGEGFQRLGNRGDGAVGELAEFFRFRGEDAGCFGAGFGINLGDGVGECGPGG